MCLSGSSSIPAADANHIRMAAATGRRIVEMVWENQTPDQIITRAAVENAMTVAMATGCSTNAIIHLVAMARAGGIKLDWEDFSELSDAVPLLARVYPNGLADVNHFHAAGGLGYVIGQLLDGGLLHPDTTTITGGGLETYTQEPFLDDGALTWRSGPKESLNTGIVRPSNEAFQP